MRDNPTADKSSREIEVPSRESSSFRKEFSFNRMESLREGRAHLRFQEIDHSLSLLDAELLRRLLLDEIERNEATKQSLVQAESQLEGSREEIRLLTESLAFKKESFLLLSENQSANEVKIANLEEEMRSFKSRHGMKSWLEKVELEWQKKYKQLSRHMDVYIENSKEVNEQLIRQRESLKVELHSAYRDNSELNLALRELTVANIGLMEHLSKVKGELRDIQGQFQKTNEHKQ